ncbi:hypothetical protein BCR43DRAFT_147664 [Syncephalastrum racemosum]|uniref:Uncharacterized protein n=1 Tax=Syncephalastrum racemosum TaxID=13706 RepID=A0A1X2HMH1_SYNRA|nr:hypothetical protein BCR43DRAFT_147664 [Syncephalastrum racemosum]
MTRINTSNVSWYSSAPLSSNILSVLLSALAMHYYLCSIVYFFKSYPQWAFPYSGGLNFFALVDLRAIFWAN